MASWSRHPETLPLLAYPYGLALLEVEVAAEKAGYTAGLLVEGGWLTRGHDRPMALPRFNGAGWPL